MIIFKRRCLVADNATLSHYLQRAVPCEIPHRTPNVDLNNLSRQDLLDFGDGRRILKIRVGTWDVTRHAVDSLTLIPKL